MTKGAETVVVTTSTSDGRLLSGGRGWTTVLVLAMALLIMVVGQVAADEARAGGLDPVPAALPLADRPATASVDRPVPGQPAQASVVPPAPQQVPAAAPADLCSGEGWQQRRGDVALASIRGGAPRTGFSVAFAPARTSYLGLTHLHEARIEVFVRACDVQSDSLLRHVVAHELGHAYDTTHMTAETRAAWQQVRGIPAATDWYGCSGCTDFATPAGDFAEVYAQWARGATDNRSELSGDPVQAELDALATQFFGA